MRAAAWHAASVQSAGSKHITANAILMVLLSVGHLLSVGSVLLNVAARALDLPMFAAPRSDAELLGNLIAFAWMGVVAVVGTVWAPINAYGLFKRRPWALGATQAYWIFLGVLCCCLPGAGYGLWSLRRSDVREALGVPR